MSPLQYPRESDSVEESTVSSLALLRDEPFLAAEANESENKTLPSKFAGQSSLSSHY